MNYLRFAPQGTWPTEPVTGHPEIPSSVLEALRANVNDTDAPRDASITWWTPDSRPAWGAVTTLHKVGLHADALALAELAHWCDEQHRDGIWEIVEAPRG
jgi:hypothetical protein